MMRIAVLSLTIAFCLGIGHADAQNISDEARRHFDRGMAAVEMAKSPADYKDAIKEFEKAARLAPGWADVYYNLGMVQEKANKYDEAVTSFRRYLRLAPNARDAETVKSLINRLEFKAQKISEQAKIPALLVGKWQGYGGDCCGGRQPMIQFRIVSDMIAVRIPVTWDADRVRRTDYKSYPVEIEGQTIRFDFKAKLLLRGLNSTSYCNMRYELRLTDPNRLEGKMFLNDNPARRVNFGKMP
ncbi:MAG: tetratricopeptide repeat protein [Desulfobacterales bacterium]|nr:tetratricopeptide repeat protein [Desulfobacterales bacterium]